MVEVGTGTSSTRFIDTEWPNTEGLTAGTTRTHEREENLVPEGINGTKTTVLSRNREGVD